MKATHLEKAIGRFFVLNRGENIAIVAFALLYVEQFHYVKRLPYTKNRVPRRIFVNTSVGGFLQCEVVIQIRVHL